MSETRKRRVNIDPRDVTGLLGIGMLFYGLWCIYQPAAFVVTGAILLGAAFIAARR